MPFEWVVGDSSKGLHGDRAHVYDETGHRELHHVKVHYLFCTQYAKKDWHQRLGGGVHADAIMDRIVHNAIWVETGEVNMREHALARTT